MTRYHDYPCYIAEESKAESLNILLKATDIVVAGKANTWTPANMDYFKTRTLNHHYATVLPGD